jgi:prevent-host-death family protein
MGARTIGIFQAKTHLSELVEQARQGECFTITHHGRPVAELGPARARRTLPRRGMAKSASFFMAPDFAAPLADFAEYQ